MSQSVQNWASASSWSCRVAAWVVGEQHHIVGIHQLHVDCLAQYIWHPPLPVRAHRTLDVLLQHLDEQAKQGWAEGVALPARWAAPTSTRTKSECSPFTLTATSDCVYSERMEAWMGPEMP